MSIKNQAAVVGVGATPYYKRGQSYPETEMSMGCTAILRALDDAGLTVNDLDGFAIYSFACDPAEVASVLGVPEVRFAASLTSGGGGCAGALGLAAAAIHAGMAEVCVSLMTLQQLHRRLGGSEVDGVLAYATMSEGGGAYGGGRGLSPSVAFAANAGLLSPGHSFSVLTQRHMYLYGTKREHFAEVAISQRENAIRRPDTALQTKPLSLDEYFAARMISEPLCLFDYTQENDGAVAVITVSADRAKDLKQPPAYILSSAHGGTGRWGPAIFRYFQAPDDEFASSGHRPVAKRLYEMAGVTPADVDVALLYDHFSPLVVMQLEDYGFCPIGEGGPFVAEGNIRYGTGTIPVNTHGGNLSEAYIIGMTHVREAVEQIRGTAVNQVEGAEVALVTGGPAALPVSGTLLAQERGMSEQRVSEQGVFPSILTHSNADDSTRPFWDAAKENRLVAPRCTNCGTFRLPPPPFCFVCQHRDVEWVELPGTGTVYAFTVVRHPLARMLHDVVPYAAGIVELDGTQGAGSRMIVNIIDCDVDTLQIGDRVAIVWEHVSDDMSVPRFRPIAG